MNYSEKECRKENSLNKAEFLTAPWYLPDSRQKRKSFEWERVQPFGPQAVTR
jgi:hypothetical protein